MPEINPLGRGTNVGADLIPVTPNNSTNLPTAARAIRCRPDGAAGTVHFNTLDGTERTTAIAVGETILVAASRIWATGTTATGLEIYV